LLIPDDCLVVLVATRAMYMAVLGFFFAGITNFGDFHLKCQRLAGQWVVGAIFGCLRYGFFTGIDFG